MACDNWVVMKIKPKDGEVFYKLLRGWSGGYTTGDSWALNSGIVGVESEGDYYTFLGESGSKHTVGKCSYGVRMNIAEVIANMENRFPGRTEVIPDCDWNSFFGGGDSL